MAKFKKDGGKKKQSNKTFSKKKVKVGRVIKKANETVPKVKVAKILIKGQFVKTDNSLLKTVKNLEDNADGAPPPHSTLLDIKKKLKAELKACKPDAKTKDKKEFLKKVLKLLQETHCHLSSVVIKIVIENICCPLMYDSDPEVRTEVPHLLRCVISKFMEAANMKQGLFPITEQSCPVLSTSLCRSLSYSAFCPESLTVVDVLCELCPKLIQSDSLNILQKLLSLLYRQTYFEVEDNPGQALQNRPRNGYLDSAGLSTKTTTGRFCAWSLPRLVIECDRHLHPIRARRSVVERISRVLCVLSRPPRGVRCEYLAHPGNVVDDEEGCRRLAEVCFEILCSAWNDLLSTNSPAEEKTVTLSAERFSLAVDILTCMKMCLEVVLFNSISRKAFSSWTQSNLRELYEDSLGKRFPFTTMRKANRKNKETDGSSTINKLAEEIQNHFSERIQ